VNVSGKISECACRRPPSAAPFLLSVKSTLGAPIMIAKPGAKKLYFSVALARSASSGPTKEMKARQNSKIRQIGEILHAAGFLTLDKQAKALGLCRSTTFTLLQGNHKASGLSPALINRMFAAPQLPDAVRAHILEYVEEKSAGLYGHNQASLRRFTASLIAERHPRRSRLPLLVK
jgi:hypothetical protein